MRVLPKRYEKSIWKIKSIVYLFKIFGLAPFSVQMKAVSNDSELIGSSTGAFVFSKFGLAYNVLLLMGFGIIVGCIPRTLFPAIDDPIHYSIHLALTAETLFVAYVVIFWWAIKQKTGVEITERLLEIDVTLSGLKNCLSNKITSLTWIAHIVINGCLWGVLWKPLATQTTSADLLKLFWKNELHIISCWFILQYAIVVGLVSKELAMLNDNLIEFKEFENNFLTGTSLLDYRYPNNRKQLAALRRLHKIRVTISEVCRDLINFFSLPILMSITHCFCYLIGSSFYLANYIIENGSLVGLQRTDIIALILISIYSCYFLFSNVEETVQEAHLTGHIIHKLLLRTMTDGVRSELERFSICLLHENFVFTAYDFFSLDFTLLYSGFTPTALEKSNGLKKRFQITIKSEFFRSSCLIFPFFKIKRIKMRPKIYKFPTWVTTAIVYVFKFHGLAPFRFNSKIAVKTSEPASSAGIFSPSTSGLVYNCLIATGLIFVEIFAAPKFFAKEFPRVTRAMGIFDVIPSLTSLTLASVIILYSGLKQTAASGIMNKLSDIEILLFTVENQLDPHRKKRVTSLAVPSVLSCFMWTSLFLSLITVRGPTYIFHVCNTLAGTVMYWFIVQYSIVVGLTGSEIENLNYKLSTLKAFKCGRPSPALFTESSVFKQRNNYNFSPLSAFNLIHKTRAMLSEVSRDIDEYFSLPILPCIAIKFVNILGNVYFSIAYYSLGKGSLTFDSGVRLISYLVIAIYPIHLLFSNVVNTIKQANLTRHIVHRLLLTATTQSVREELEHFSLWLLHENINFSAHGVFPLDFSLLHSILAAIATYLVILLQFQ
ncbi:uncharacterized protein LOC105691255 [Athalia rosae]|uniref:uncharacterized protein LOC105691255 n=1 Tax=Athalia rosae TaxID=37344 RepID=UPI0020342F75|nr:uncharacterized protein LOC105691255 [Athalia rosae]